ncbi:glycosyltransferase family 2 protein [Azohydromonas sediminis]|uniref:glycosyltransferase family 2 protein n=1 Tax=Azohydromonas sediminis TaxID=2259674 RepID=UPI000E65A0B0|nr:glycosyltransferase family 2 protein [Azohydromonas sediminis]
MSYPRILIAAPVRQHPAILKEFLDSIRRLDINGLQISCAFIDDNDNADSSRMLQSFAFGEESVVTPAPQRPTVAYIRNDITHHWREDLIWRVAAFKDFLIECALESGFDYLFLVDSDLVLNPFTLQHLVACDKEIISEVFWTSWQPGQILMPQVWTQGQYELAWRRRDEKISPDESDRRILAFIRGLHQPSLTRVGGLGACTLIKRTALEKGVRFAEIDNLTYWGEDRHFCVRARALGVELWADSTYAPLHLYRQSLLDRVPRYVNWSSVDHWRHPSITLSMVVRNESGRYLEKALMRHREFIDRAVIIDDASEDDTVDIVTRCLHGIQTKIVRLPNSHFHNEVALRKIQWKETVETCPDWILNLDADEILEDGCGAAIRDWAHQTQYRYIGFSLFDMWDDYHYRDDALWNAHRRLWGFMFRYSPLLNYEWKESAQHCGRFPRSVEFFEMGCSNIRIQHMGWARRADRERKYRRYLELDPQGRHGSMAQYASILDESPHLVRWTESRLAAQEVL